MSPVLNETPQREEESKVQDHPSHWVFILCSIFLLRPITFGPKLFFSMPILENSALVLDSLDEMEKKSKAFPRAATPVLPFASH